MVLKVMVPDLNGLWGATSALYHSPFFEGGGGGVEGGKRIATCMIPRNSLFKNDPILCALRVKQNVARFEAWNSLQMNETYFVIATVSFTQVQMACKASSSSMYCMAQ